MEGSRAPRPPSDVEEALSSMLWTPYPQDTDSSSSDESEVAVAAYKKRPFTWACPNDDLFTITDRFPPYYVPPTSYLPSYNEIRPAYSHQSSTQISNYLDNSIEYVDDGGDGGRYVQMVHSLTDTFLHNQVN